MRVKFSLNHCQSGGKKILKQLLSVRFYEYRMSHVTHYLGASVTLSDHLLDFLKSLWFSRPKQRVSRKL